MWQTWSGIKVFQGFQIVSERLIQWIPWWVVRKAWGAPSWGRDIHLHVPGSFSMNNKESFLYSAIIIKGLMLMHFLTRNDSWKHGKTNKWFSIKQKPSSYTAAATSSLQPSAHNKCQFKCPDWNPLTQDCCESSRGWYWREERSPLHGQCDR